MKHLIFVLAFLFAGMTAYAAPGANWGDHVNVVDVLPLASISASGNGTGADMSQYAGQIFVQYSALPVSGTTPTMDLKIQDSADNSSFADVSGAAFTQVTTGAVVNQTLVLNKDNLRRYIRVVKTAGGTSPVYLMSAKVLAVKKYPQ